MPASKSLGQAGVVISAPGADEFARRLQRWASRIEDASPQFREMVRMLRTGEGEVFDSSGRAIGTNWAGLAEPERGGSQLLVATGRLRASLASQTGDSVAQVTPTRLTFSTRVPYGHFHEFGTSRMPARPFMGMSQATRKRIMDMMHRLSVQLSEASAASGANL